MLADITIKNYRCFPDSRPVRIALHPGFTAFIGPNNSGKSSLLRLFYELRGLLKCLSNPDANFAAGLTERNAFEIARSVVDNEEIFCNANNRGMELILDLRGGPQKHDVAGKSVEVARSLNVTIPRGQNTWAARLSTYSRDPVSQANIKTRNGLVIADGGPADPGPLCSIASDLVRTLYIGAFRNAINIGAKEEYFDIDVGQKFIQNWRVWKTGANKRYNELTYRLTNDIRRVFGFRDLQIDASQGEDTLQVFLDSRSYKLPELGSGLAQFILVLANAAMKEPSYILIDEPELNLHPSLQLDFLTTLATYASRGVLFATHSIGLARTAAESIYSVRLCDDGLAEVLPYEATPRLSEFLGELSFSGYRDLGFDQILLVEGPSDIKTIQQLLRLYGKDHKNVVLHLGGASLIRAGVEHELEEIKRISDRTAALIDSEREVAGADLEHSREEFVKLCKVAGIRCHVLARCAIENYFPDHAIKAVKGEKYAALGPHEPRKKAELQWGKHENWRIARQMTLQDLAGTDLDDFLKLL